MKFRNEYSFLSNFFECPVTLQMRDGKEHTFQNAEAAFQAFKPKNSNVISSFEKMTGPVAKKHGKKVCIPEGIEWWNDNRVPFMEKVIRAKFEQNPELLKKIKEINQEPIVEDNTWHDTFWGVCNGKGQNNLGKILEKVKAE